MSDVVYRSHVRIERVKGPVRRAYLPAEREPIVFGVHGAVAEHYKVAAAVLEPNILANGPLVTTDVGETCCMFAAVFAFYLGDLRSPNAKLKIK
jgi:hypothetical protein